MSGLNKVTLIGHLGKDPELKYTQGQKPYARFSLATTERFVDANGEKRENTQWHNCVVWGKQAETVDRFLKKGKQIYLEGKIEYRKYDDKTGQTRYTTDIRVDRFLFLGGPGGSGGGEFPNTGERTSSGYDAGSNRGSGPQNYGGPASYDDQIPESDHFNDEDLPF
jgi:single-strand DNA-binding protein